MVRSVVVHCDDPDGSLIDLIAQQMNLQPISDGSGFCCVAVDRIILLQDARVF
ncbi:MAG: hypothetical protein QF801_03130 [Alphaproteobacteria bacterium]|jgi:hypothetical protein|nr:hypothetical protein [Alphaproteobacteria bacterium]